MKKPKNMRRFVMFSLLVSIAVSIVTTPVAATFSGSASPDFDHVYVSASVFEEASADDSGLCELRLEEAGWPNSYDPNERGVASVSVEFVPSEDITNNWELTANFEIDYELSANWWSTIEIDVYFCVRDENNAKIWPYFSEYHDEVDSQGIFWEYASGQETTTETAGWGIDLDEGETYYFCIELWITIVDGGAVYANSYSSSSEPASLTVNSISWGY